MLINGADPQLAASASGILLANGFLTSDQYAAALRYGWAHAMTFGRPWSHTCLYDDGRGHEARDELLEVAKERLAAMDAVLSLEQRQAVGNVAVFGFVPMWFWTERLKLRSLATDERERAALIGGLERLARV